MKRLCWSTFLILALVCAGSAFADSLAVNNAAAIDGNFGMAVTVDGTLVKANVKNFCPQGPGDPPGPTDETTYRASFKIDMNNLNMNDGDRHDIFVVRSAPCGGGLGNRNEAFVWIRFDAGQQNPYKVNLSCRLDNGQWRFAGKTSLPPAGARTLMMEWQAATAPGANNGICNIYFNGNLKGGRADLDNDERAIGAAWMGSVNRIAAASNGTMFYDTFESFRTLAP